MSESSNLAVTGTGRPLTPARAGRGNASGGGAPAGGSEGSVPVAILRITLGVIVLATWYDNLTGDLYTASGLEGFFDWLYSPDGNDSSLGFYRSFLDSVIRPIAGPYAVFQLVFELLIGVGLLVGVFTRFFSLSAIVFFFSIFLAYFGGEEWIWTYVLLIAASVTVFLGYGGRQLGFDRYLRNSLGDSPLGNLLW